MVTPCASELMDPAAPAHVTLSHEDQRARVVIVGDIHGCYDEFCELLETHCRLTDTIILAGDLVNKGPRSAEVVRLARQKRCLAVVGNHELASLKGVAERKGGASPEAAQLYAWTDHLQTDDIEYIRGLPYTISLPLHGAIVVHAGLVPGVELDQQRPEDMVSMRNLVQLTPVKDSACGASSPENLEHAVMEYDDGSEPYGAIWKCAACGWEAGRGGPRPSCPRSGGISVPPYRGSEVDIAEGIAWATRWTGPTHVYFGHDAKRRLQQQAHATGLDTGVLYGGELTAAILELGKPPRLVNCEIKVLCAEVQQELALVLIFLVFLE
eukprot:gene10469-12380_t